MQSGSQSRPRVEMQCTEYIILCRRVESPYTTGVALMHLPCPIHSPFAMVDLQNTENKIPFVQHDLFKFVLNVFLLLLFPKATLIIFFGPRFSPMSLSKAIEFKFCSWWSRLATATLVDVTGIFFFIA